MKYHHRRNIVLLTGSWIAAFLLTVTAFVSPVSGSLQVLQYKAAILLSLSFLILPIWASGGVSAGIIYLFFSFSCSTILTIKNSEIGLILFPLITLGFSFILGSLSKRTSIRERLEEIKMEEIHENQNTLRVSLKKIRGKTSALKQKIERYSHLNDACDTLSSNLDLDYIVNFIITELVKIMGKGDLDLLYLVDEKTQGLALANVKNIKGGKENRVKSKKGDLYDKWVLKQRQALIVDDTKKDFRFSFEEEEIEKKRPFRSLVSVPLIAEEKMLGVLRLESNDAECFTPDDLRLLSIIGHLSSVALENAILYKKTEELAIRDSLTGLYVHRYFQERFQEEIHRAMSTNSFLSFVMCDLDHFKEYNDKYGHPAGDVLLKGLSKELCRKIKAGDLAARYGGEEFALVLPRRSKQEAVELAESIRESIEKKEFSLRKKKTRITISMGVVTFPMDAMMKQDLIRRADEALYRAKEKGRNRVEAC